MQIEHYALILLIIRIIAVALIIRVIAIQTPLLKAVNDPHLTPLRVALLVMSYVLLLGNTIPVVIDILTVFQAMPRSAQVLTESTLVYGFSNAITSVIAAATLRIIYKTSADADK